MRIVVEELEAEWRARMELVVEVKSLRGDTTGKSFDKPPTPDKSVRSGRDIDNVPEDETVNSYLKRPLGFEDLTAPSLQPDTSTGEGNSSPGKDIIEATGFRTNCLTFDVDLPETIEA